MKGQTYSDGTTPTICIIGAGFSGILAGVKLKSELGFDFVIFDQNEEVGGVWLANTYPGSGSDAPSHLYSFSFERNPNWSTNYASQQEILEYLQNISRKYELYSSIMFNSEVKRIVWDEAICQWRISVFDRKTTCTKEYLFQIVINAPGALRVPNLPKQFETFQGPKFHSSTWDPSIDLTNKTVAVIGSGASAVQIIPQLVSKVKELHCYQRKPPWVMPKGTFKYPTLIKWLFAYIPLLLTFYRWLLFWKMEIFYPALKKGTVLRQIAKWHARRHMQNQIPRQEMELLRKVTPKHRFGCTRTIVSDDYLPALAHPKVTVHDDPIIDVTGNYIETKQAGKIEIDVLILATGFHVQEYFAPMSIIGKSGFDLLTSWIQGRPKGYLGIVTSSTPNQFGMLGPHTGLGHNSVIFMAECQMTYIVGLIREMLARDAGVIELKGSTEDEELKILDEQMSKMVWGHGGCGGSWYENASGLNTTLWPWSCVNYWKRTRKPDFSKFNFYQNPSKLLKIELLNNNQGDFEDKH